MTPAARLFIALSLLLSAGSSWADEPLPSGAIRRLGDPHLRMAGRTPPALSPNGQLVAWRANANTLRLTEFATGKAIKDVTVPPEVSFDRPPHFLDPAGDRLLFLNHPESKLLDTKTGKVTHTFKDHGWKDGHWVVARDGSTGVFVSGSPTRAVAFWDLRAVKRLGEYKSEYDIMVDLSGDGTTAVVSVDGYKKVNGQFEDDKYLEVIDVKTAKPLRRITTDKHARLPGVSFDGKLVATKPVNSGRTEVRDTATGKVAVEFDDTRLGFTGFSSPYRFSKDATRLAMYFANGSSVVWDLGKKAVVADSKRENTDLTDMAFTDANDAVAVGQHLQAVLTWKVNGEAAALPVGHAGDVQAVRFTPDGKQLLTFGRDLRLLRWDVATGKLLGVAFEDTYSRSGDSGPNTDYNLPLFSADAKYLVAVSQEQKTRVIDRERGKVAAELKAGVGVNPFWMGFAFSAESKKVFAYGVRAGGLTAVGCAWSLPDGKLLDSQKWDGKKDQSVPLGEEFFAKKYADEWPKAAPRKVTVAFRPKEDIYSRTGYRVTVADAGEARPALEFDSRAMFTNAVALSPDGTKLAVGWNDTTVLLFDVPTPKK